MRICRAYYYNFIMEAICFAPAAGAIPAVTGTITSEASVGNSQIPKTVRAISDCEFFRNSVSCEQARLIVCDED